MDPIIGWWYFAIAYVTDPAVAAVTNILALAAFVGTLGLLIP